MSQTLELVERLSDIVVRKPDRAKSEWDPTDPLLCSCRIVGEELGIPITLSQRAQPAGQAFSEILDIARTAQLRVRRVVLRDVWWKTDVGPLLGWSGDQRSPVALVGHWLTPTRCSIRKAEGIAWLIVRRRRAQSGGHRFLSSIAAHPLQYRDLLAFAMRGVSGSIARIALAVLAIGLLSLMPPLLTNVLVSSVIRRPRSISSLFVRSALTVTAVAMATWG